MSSQELPDSAANWQLAERANRLRQAVRAGGGNLAVSQRSGVPLSNLTRYLRAEEMKVSTLVALAEACNVSVDWLAAGRGAMHQAAERPIVEMHTQQPRPPAPEALSVTLGPMLPLPGMDEPPAASPAPSSSRLNVAALAKAIEIVEAVAGINAFRDNPKVLAERIASTYALLTRPDLDNSPPLAGP